MKVGKARISDKRDDPAEVDDILAAAFAAETRASVSPAAIGAHFHHRRPGTHTERWNATPGNGIKGKLASLVVGDDP